MSKQTATAEFEYTATVKTADGHQHTLRATFTTADPPESIRATLEAFLGIATELPETLAKYPS